jgi:hypothetical protein
MRAGVVVQLIRGFTINFIVRLTHRHIREDSQLLDLLELRTVVGLDIGRVPMW